MKGDFIRPPMRTRPRIYGDAGISRLIARRMKYHRLINVLDVTASSQLSTVVPAMQIG